MKHVLPTVIAIVVGLLGSEVNAQEYRVRANSLQFSKAARCVGFTVSIGHPDEGGELPSNGRRLDHQLFIWKLGNPFELVAIIDDISLRERNFNWCFAGSDSLCYLQRSGDLIEKDTKLVSRELSSGNVEVLADSGHASTLIGGDHGHILVLLGKPYAGDTVIDVPVIDAVAPRAMALDLSHGKQIGFSVDGCYFGSGSGCWIGESPRFVYGGDDGNIHLLNLFDEQPSHHVVVRLEELMTERMRAEGATHSRFTKSSDCFLPAFVGSSTASGDGFYFLNRFTVMIEKYDLGTGTRSVICPGKIDPDDPGTYDCKVVDSAGVLYTLDVEGMIFPRAAEGTRRQPLERIISPGEKQVVTDRNFRYIAPDKEGGIYGSVENGEVVHVSEKGELKTVVSLEMIEQAYRDRFKPAGGGVPRPPEHPVSIETRP